MTVLTCPALGHPYLGSGLLTAYNQLDAGDFAGYATEELFSLPIGAVIVDLMVNITEAWSSSVTVTLGDGADTDRYMDDTIFAPTATGTKGMKQDAQPGSGGGHHYAAADTIDMVVAGATPTAGTAEFYLVYIARQYMHSDL